MLLEIACFNIESALIAQRAGADRIELCQDYSAGGVSPTFETIRKARKQLSIPIFVMIRPRKGNFVYTDAELSRMKEEILLFKETGIDGIVFGILDSSGKINKGKCKELVGLAMPMQSTFHRAFDDVKAPLDAMEDIIACGFRRILTSGQEHAAQKGAEIISLLIKKANGRIIIMPAGGIRSNNISEIKKKTSATEFHSAALNTETMLADENEIRKLKSMIE